MASKSILIIKNRFTLSMKKISFVLLLLQISFFSAQAQGNLGDEQIDVVKAYQPMLSDAFKISDIPPRDTAVSYTPDMKYAVNPVKFPTIYTITPIKPLRIKDDNIKKLYHGYVKGGYGTKNTPFAELFFNSLRSKTIDAGVHLNYLSSSGKIKNYGHPGMSEAGLKLFGTRFFNNSLLKAELGYNRSAYHYYGYNKPPDIFSKSATKHTFDDLYGNFQLRSTDKNKDQFRYDGMVSFYDFSDNKSHDETDFIFSGSLGQLINDMDFSANIELDFLQYKTISFGTDNRAIIRIDPRFMKEFGDIKLIAGANIPIEINDLTKYHLYPHVRLELALAEETMTIYGQLTGNLERNSYRNFAIDNPFLRRDFELRNSNKKLDVSAGMKIKIDKQLAFIGSFGLKQYSNDAFFRNYTAISTLQMYDVMYDNNTQTNIHVEVIYDQGEKAGITLAADYLGNKPSREDKPLFRPDFKFSANGYYTISEKIYFNAQLNYVTPRYYISYGAPGNSYEYKTIKGFFDANIGVDYRYTKVMSVFLKVNNLTASKYSRWYNYPSYGFGVMGGVSYAF